MQENNNIKNKYSQHFKCRSSPYRRKTDLHREFLRRQDLDAPPLLTSQGDPQPAQMH